MELRLSYIHCYCANLFFRCYLFVCLHPRLLYVLVNKVRVYTAGVQFIGESHWPAAESSKVQIRQGMLIGSCKVLFSSYRSSNFKPQLIPTGDENETQSNMHGDYDCGICLVRYAEVTTSHHREY